MSKPIIIDNFQTGIANSRLGKWEPAIPTKLIDWKSVPSINSKGKNIDS